MQNSDDIPIILTTLLLLFKYSTTTTTTITNDDIDNIVDYIYVCMYVGPMYDTSLEVINN